MEGGVYFCNIEFFLSTIILCTDVPPHYDLLVASSVNRNITFNRGLRISSQNQTVILFLFSFLIINDLITTKKGQISEILFKLGSLTEPLTGGVSLPEPFIGGA